MVVLTSFLFDVFVIFWLIILAWIIYKSFTEVKNIPPGPWGLPLIGYLPWLPKRNFHLHVTQLQKKHGPLISFYVGRHLVVVIGNYKLIREAYVSQGEIFAGKPRHSPLEIDGDERGISVSDGPIWREQRRFVLKTLRDYGVGKQSMEPAIKEEISCFLQELKRLNGAPVQLRERLGTSVSNNICSLEFGKRFDYTDANFVKIKQLLDDFTLQLELIPITMIFSWVKNIPGSKYFMNYGKLRKIKWKIYEFIGKIVATHEDEFDKAEHRDLIYAWLDKISEDLEFNGDENAFNKDNMFFNLLSLFIAGSQTVNSTLLTGIYLLTKYPEIQAKCRQEINDNIGNDRLPSLTDRPLLPYVEATLLEVQRFISVNPLGLVHKCLEDTSLNGYIIPQNSVVFSNLYAVHYDPEMWPEPTEFRPERFLNDQMQIINQEKIIPFSIGKRVCLGMALAKTELFLYFSAFFQNFEFLPPIGKKFEVEFQGGVVRMPELFEIRALALDTSAIK